ncbi:hypothetical protein [Geminocystis sp.]|uniref:hypothetical protein n=1 Tax=Geminocystis sp. TaxID=2664100 RepID=UPI003593AB5D
MKRNFNIQFLNGFGGLLGKLAILLGKFFPIYILIFIAYGDSFLPSPLSDLSYNTRTKINEVLLGSVNTDKLKNNKYNNKKNDKVVEDTMK